MAQILQMLRSYTNYPSYDRLYKKDDDLGVEQAELWVRKYPINDEEVKTWELQKIKTYVLNLLKDLKSVSITSANKNLVEKHLVAACQCDPTMRVTIKRDIEMRGSQLEIKEIRNTLIFTYGR